MRVPDAFTKSYQTFITVRKVIEGLPFPSDDAPNNPDKVIDVFIPFYSFELTFICPHSKDNLALVDKLVHNLLEDVKLSYSAAMTSYFKNSASVILELEG